FRGADIAETFTRVAQAFPGPAGISPAVDAVLARGMAKASGARFPSVTELADALRNAALELAVPAQTVAPTPTPVPVAESPPVSALVWASQPEPAPAPAPRRRVWALGLGTVATGIVTLLYFNGGDPTRLFSAGWAQATTPTFPPAPAQVPERSD